MLVLAKIQQRPLCFWFVMGPPSKGILMLKTCGAAILAALEASTSRGSAELRAERASLDERFEFSYLAGLSLPVK